MANLTNILTVEISNYSNQIVCTQECPSELLIQLITVWKYKKSVSILKGIVKDSSGKIIASF